MPIIYPDVPYAPIIQTPTERLIYQPGSRTNRTEYQMDTREKKYLGLLPYYEALAEAMIGTYDTDYPGLKCIAWTADEGDIKAIVTLQYKGITAFYTTPSGRIPVKPPFYKTNIQLSSASVNDNGYNDPSGTGRETQVSFQYYSAQTTWFYCVQDQSIPYTAIIGPDIEIVPFNTNPPTPVGDLNWTTQTAVLNFHSEQAGDWVESEATTGIQVIPNNLPTIGG